VAPRLQLLEVIRRFQLARAARPFTRCTRCNERLTVATKEEVAARVPARSLACFTSFLRCPGCGRVYWHGSHYQHLRALIDEALS
jgi:uncharacterized protein with PIN domain